MNNLNVNNTRNGNIFLGVFLAVLLLSVNGWSYCKIERNGVVINPPVSGGECVYDQNWNDSYFFDLYESVCPSVWLNRSSDWVYTSLAKDVSTSATTEGCSWRYIRPQVNSCTYSVSCTSVCEADSIVCQNAGGTWTNTGASTCDGKSCKMSNCLQSDTLWLNDSKAACDAIGGENNYAIADIDETCVHSGICCSPDSALVGNTCKWRCDSLYAACNAKNGYLYAGVLQDTTISGSDSTFTNKCYYNCSYAYNKDSTTSVTDGNTACSSPSTPIADCTRMPNDFSSVRTTYGDSVYSYDFLTPGSAAYIDSIVLTPCSRFMYRCTVNGKYKYWYSDADIPTGCTNIVKIK